MHPEFDFAVFTTCPRASAKALNVSAFAVPELGDDLLVYGFGVVGSVWEGVMFRVAKMPNAVNCSLNPAQHWSGETRICAGEFIAQGHQHEGMSGSAVLNGCGYVGTAHATNTPVGTQRANFAVIIPAMVIFEFIDLHADKLSTLEDCKLQPQMPPVAGFVECSDRHFPVCLTDSCEYPNS